jgi:hypothetical protein
VRSALDLWQAEEGEGQEEHTETVLSRCLQWLHQQCC